MGGFAIPSLPSMPSISSMRSIINISPPLVYPSTNTTRTRIPEDNTPTRRRSVSRGSSHFPSSPSVRDVNKEWEVVNRGRRGSVHSLDGGEVVPCPYPQGVVLLPNTDASPMRRGHRRAHSAAPRRLQAGMRDQGPLGRLHEISRNPLTSSSCISLPTLCEMGPEISDLNTHADLGDEDVFRGSSAPTSPLAAPRTRRSSKATAIVPLDLTSSTSSLMISNLANNPPRKTKRSHARFASSVPPPNAMPPPPLPSLPRPPISPRSWSVQDVRPQQRAGVPSGLGRRSSIASTSIKSEVAVLATWSFPTSSSKQSLNPQSDRILDQPSDRLRERLKKLSSLDTVTPPAQSSGSSCTPPRQAYTDHGVGLGRSNSTKTPRNHVQGHRHTHSSPNLLPLNPISLSGPPASHMPLQPPVHALLPPPRPTRRPTTSRLRQPNLLSMPVDTGSNSFTHDIPSTRTTGIYPTGGMAPGCSSPGSMTSDSRSIGSGSDVDALSSPTGSIISLPSVSQHVVMQERSGLKSWKSRTSVSSLLSIADKQSIKGGCTGSSGGGIEELDIRMKGSFHISTVKGSEVASDGSEEESEDERYLTMDDI